MSDSLQSEIAKRWLDLMESVRQARHKGLTVAYEAIAEDGRRYSSTLCPDKGMLTLGWRHTLVIPGYPQTSGVQNDGSEGLTLGNIMVHGSKGGPDCLPLSAENPGLVHCPPCLRV